MCSWYPVTSEKAKSRRKGRQRRYDYLWDLDDGRPGFVRQTKRDRLRIFVDSDSDGLFTDSDELVGRARIKKAYRGIARGKFLKMDLSALLRLSMPWTPLRRELMQTFREKLVWFLGIQTAVSQ